MTSGQKKHSQSDPLQIVYFISVCTGAVHGQALLHLDRAQQRRLTRRQRHPVRAEPLHSVGAGAARRHVHADADRRDRHHVVRGARHSGGERAAESHAQTQLTGAIQCARVAGEGN